MKRMKKLGKLMKNVSLHTLSKIKPLPKNKKFIVFYKDDKGDYACNRKVSIAASLLQLDAVLCYARREVDHVEKIKVTRAYAAV